MRTPNKLMVSTNLYFNTSLVKKYMKNKICSDVKEIIKKDKVTKVSVGNSYISLTSYIEILVFNIMEKTILNIEKDNNGLFTIFYNDIENTIYKNQDLKNNFVKYIHQYDKTIDYSNIFYFNQKIIKDYIDLKFGKSINISNDGISFISFILIKTMNDLIDSSYIIMKYYNKCQMNARLIILSASIIFNGEFLKLLKIKLEETIHLYMKEKENIKTKKDNENNDEEENENKENIDDNKENVIENIDDNNENIDDNKENVIEYKKIQT
jgi:hypothetical protein